jgi:uncharacterized protein (TIGR02302 family)
MVQQSGTTRTALERRLQARLKPWLWLARAGLLWERLWPALWPPVGLGGLFLVLALFDLPARLPAWLHALLLALFAGATGFLLWRGLRALARPSAAEARRRLETDSGLAHRPLALLDERLAGGAGDPAAEALWSLHRARLLSALGALRLKLPRAGLAARDPWGLRAGLVLLLVIGFVAARGDIAPRIERALLPGFAPAVPAEPPRFDIWITPPAYTGLAPILLSSAQPTVPPGMQADGEPAAPRALSIAENSAVLAQIENGRERPTLQLGDQSKPFEPLAERSWRLEGVHLVTGDTIALQAGGRTLGRWPIEIVPDQPPTVQLTADPGQTERGVLKLSYTASDDYGVERIAAKMTPVGAAAGVAPIELDLPVPGDGPRRARAESFHDLTANPLAGSQVLLTLEARDAAGQIGRSETHAMVLPERPFHHPVARAIVALRRALALEPDRRRSVAGALDKLAADTEAYSDDIVVTLSLSAAAARLRYERDLDAGLPAVQRLLWDTALRVEEGETAVALQRLRDAQEALERALDQGASDQELSKLMDELRQAMNQFLDALVEKMKRELAEGRRFEPVDPDQMTLGREDLQRMLDQAQQMAEAGARDAARSLLSRLREMLENLEANPYAGQMQQGESEASRLMQKLQDLARQQQQLLDRSFRDAQRSEQGGEPQEMEGAAGDQEALRQALGEVMRRFGEMTGDIPAPLGRAERAMKDAVGALQRQDPGSAGQAQAQALQELMQGTQEMMKALAERFGSRPGGAPRDQLLGQQPDPSPRTEDGNGLIDTGDVKIPAEGDLQRAREILEELRRRSSEQFRPKIERDYLHRLLERF